VGKTTLLNYLDHFEEVTVISEPVHKWTNLEGSNLLDLMYSNPQRWSFVFQSYVQLTMLQVHECRVNTRLKIQERSIHSAIQVFAKHLLKSGKLARVEMAVLQAWYQYIIEHHQVEIDAIIYLRADPHECYARVLKREGQQTNIPEQYVVELHNIYDEWAQEKQHGVPVFIINANKTQLEIQLDIYFRFSVLLTQ
jgi:deoxyadenosine/deoxycytidine kinase